MEDNEQAESKQRIERSMPVYNEFVLPAEKEEQLPEHLLAKINKAPRGSTAEYEYQKKALISILYQEPPGMRKPNQQDENLKFTEDSALKIQQAGANAPNLGKIPRVLLCWRCRQPGHRAGDKICPFYTTGNITNEVERRMREDPMSQFAQHDAKSLEKEQKRMKLHVLLQHLIREDDERKKRKMSGDGNDSVSSSSDDDEKKRDKKKSKKRKRSKSPSSSRDKKRSRHHHK